MLYNMSYPHDHAGAPPAAAVAGQQPIKPTMAPAGAAAIIRPPRQRCSQPMPFDPEELSQKLNKVIADRQAYSERRRRARAEAAAGGNAAPLSPTSAAPQQLPHASMAREIFEQGTLKPVERRRSVINPVRPRTEPAAKKPAAPKERPDTSAARPKSKMSDDSRSSSSKSKDSSKSKHFYIPQFAASQFARTTTSDTMPEGKGLVHKLSRTALRIAQAHRERHQQERKNFYSDRIPEDETQPIEHRAHRDRNYHRHTIEGAPAGHHAEDRRARAARRASTGAADLLMTWESGTSSPNPDGDSSEVPDQDPYERRVDWTQRDEAPHHQPEQQQQQPQRQKSRPSLRSADSIWALRNKLSALTKHKQEDHQQQRSRDGSPPSDTTLRSPKSGFFARFKVNH